MTNTEIITIITNVIMIIAIVVGPVAAVQVQGWLERAREEKRRKIQLFTTLMATRATILSPLHVEALNRIDIEFYKDKKIRDLWKALFDNFESYPKDVADKDYPRRLEACNEKSMDLRVELLFEMAISLGYDIDKVHIKRVVYQPQVHNWIETEENVIRHGWAQVLVGNKPLPISLINPANQADKTGQIVEGPKE
ncbi:MAG: hypothetical protein HZA03_11605 [Nitrospinae bacterium]|nr:hypothetical protein [Nitrospinota bacterium]